MDEMQYPNHSQNCKEYDLSINGGFARIVGGGGDFAQASHKVIAANKFFLAIPNYLKLKGDENV